MADNRALDATWQSAVDYYRLWKIRRQQWWISRSGLSSIETRLAADIQLLGIHQHSNEVRDPNTAYVHYAIRVNTSHLEAQQQAYRDIYTQLAAQPDASVAFALQQVLIHYPHATQYASQVHLWNKELPDQPEWLLAIWIAYAQSLPNATATTTDNTTVYAWEMFQHTTEQQRATLIEWAAYSPTVETSSHFFATAKRIYGDKDWNDLSFDELHASLLGYILRRQPIKPSTLLAVLTHHKDHPQYALLLKTALLSQAEELQEPLIDWTQRHPESGLDLLWLLGYPAVIECALTFLIKPQWAMQAAKAWHGITGQILTERIQLQTIGGTASAGALVPDAEQAKHWWQAHQPLCQPGQPIRFMLGHAIPAAEQPPAALLQHALHHAAGAQTQELLNLLNCQSEQPILLSPRLSSDSFTPALKRLKNTISSTTPSAVPWQHIAVR